LSVAKAKAQEDKKPFYVMTFEPHPKAFFAKDKTMFRLTTQAQKNKWLQRAGVEGVLLETFDPSYASQSAEQFMRRVFSTLDASDVFIGENFRFGSQRQGTLSTLHEHAQHLGRRVHAVPVLKDETQTVVSSSQIRDLLCQGQVEAAAEQLGHPFEVQGTVFRGHQLGRQLGFPTANIRPPWGCALRYGIYVVELHTKHEHPSPPYRGLASYGIRPTVNTGEPWLEVHIPHVELDLYDREINVAFLRWVRDERNFDTIDELIVQMHRDVGCITHNQK